MYVILGGTGRVGGATATALLQQGEPVTVVTRDAAKTADWQTRGAKIAVADIHDTAALRAAFGRGTRLFIMNPQADPATDTDAEEHATIRSILDALDGSGVGKIVALSTYGAHAGEPAGDLTTLHALEEGLKAQPIPATIVRAAYLMSNWDGLVDMARADGAIPSFFPADFMLPMVAPRDLGVVAARLLTEPIDQSGLYFAEGPEQYCAADVAAILGDLLGKAVEVQTAPRDALTETFAGMGFSPAAAASYARMTEKTMDAPDTPTEPVRGPTSLRAYLEALVGASDNAAT